MTELPVQRLVLILPPEEQPQEVLAGLASFPRMPAARVVLPGGQPIQEAEQAQGEPRGEQGQPRMPRLMVQVPQQMVEMGDLPRPQRARGRPRREL